MVVVLIVIGLAFGATGVGVYDRFTASNRRFDAAKESRIQLALANCRVLELMRSILQDAEGTRASNTQRYEYYQRQFDRINTAERLLPIKCKREPV